MEITQINIDEVNAELKIDVIEDDYSLIVEKKLKDHQKTMKIDGFRPGKIPFGVIKSKFYKGVLADEVNKMVYDKIEKYLTQNNIEIFGQAIPDMEKSNLLNVGEQKNFTLYYKLGLVPVIKIEELENIEVNYYNISVTDEEVDYYVKDIRKRYGVNTNPEVSSNTDVLDVELTELDEAGNEKAGGITKSTTVNIELIKNDVTQKKLIGLKNEKTIDISLLDIFANEYDIAQKLSIDHTNAAGLTNPFRMKVIQINHNEPAEINEELFSKVYANDNIVSEEQLRERIRQDARLQWVAESDKKFFNDVIETIFDKTKIQLPDAFLKQWMYDISKEKHSFAQIEAEYKYQADSLRLQMIETKIMKDNNIAVNDEDIKEYYKDYFRKSVLGGQVVDDFPEEKITEFAENMFAKRKDNQKIMEMISEERMKELFKARIKMKELEVTYAEFVTLASSKYNFDHDHDHYDHDGHDHDHHDHDGHDHDHHDHDGHDHDHHDHEGHDHEH